MTELERLRSITAQELLSLGLSNIAYVKDVEVDGGTAVALCAANGHQIAIVPDRATAIAAAWKNGLAPLTLQ